MLMLSCENISPNMKWLNVLLFKPQTYFPMYPAGMRTTALCVNSVVFMYHLTDNFEGGLSVNHFVSAKAKLITSTGSSRKTHFF